MKNKAILIALGFLPLISVAQVTIKSPEDFTIGTTLKFQGCDTTGIKPGLLGAKQTWDFSTLKPTKQSTETIIAPADAPNSSKYPKTTQVEKNSDGSYVYVEKEALNSLMLAYVSGNNTIEYTKPMIFAKRPTNFGGTNSYPYASKMNWGGIQSESTGMSTIAAEGYGTLILPDKKKYTDVLRIKITQKEKNAQGNMTITTYVWFDDKHKSALLKISIINTPQYNSKSVEYLLSEEDK